MQIEGFRGRELHAEGQLKRGDPRFERIVDEPLALVDTVQPRQRVKLPPQPVSIVLWVFQVVDGIIEIADPRRLVGSGQKARSPQGRTLEDRFRTDHHESRQVFVLGAQSVRQPCPRLGRGNRSSPVFICRAAPV